MITYILKTGNVTFDTIHSRKHMDFNELRIKQGEQPIDEQNAAAQAPGPATTGGDTFPLTTPDAVASAQSPAAPALNEKWAPKIGERFIWEWSGLKLCTCIRISENFINVLIENTQFSNGSLSNDPPWDGGVDLSECRPLTDEDCKIFGINSEHYRLAKRS